MGRGRRTIATLLLAVLLASIVAIAARPSRVLANRSSGEHPDAAALYSEHCAGCHGKEGHGDGPTAAELKYRPRDFKAGSFAFGNTTGAMVKTILSGIPGEEQARMPPFKGVLTVEEIESIVELVRTMMPAEVLPTAAEMKMEPRDGPLVARGLLAPFKAGDPPIARGLLVGLPSGFTFEYATDGVKLLAVRRGEFVTRSDWEERGGRPLTPLGDVVGTLDLEASLPQFSWNNATGPSLRAKLRSTAVAKSACTLTFDVLDAAGEKYATVRETPGEAVVAGGVGFTRRLEIDAGARKGSLAALVFALPENSEGPHLEFWRREDAMGIWLTRKTGDGGFMSSRFDVDLDRGECEFVVDGSMWYGAFVRLNGKPATLRWSSIYRRDLPEAAFPAMTKELGR